MVTSQNLKIWGNEEATEMSSSAMQFGYTMS